MFKKSANSGPPSPTHDEKVVVEQYDTNELGKEVSADGSAKDNEAQHDIDPVIEKRVVRKLDLNVVPLVFTLYLLAFLDRSNIGNAYTAGMNRDLDLTADRYQWLLTIFYISYIVFEVGIVCWKIFPPHYWAAFVTFGWGICSTLQVVVQTWNGEMAIRFLMGAFEAAYGPGIPYLLSFFYLRHELGFRAGIFLSAAPLASTFAGALAYGITSGHPSLASWRVLFLVEGLPTLCMVPVAFFFLPDSPQKARFLTPEEKEVAISRGVRQTGTSQRIGGIVWKDVGLTLLDAKAWFTALMYFSCNVSFSSLPVFLPQILDDMGFTSVNAQGLSAPPYFISFLVTCGTTYIADRTQQRGLMIMLLSAVAGIGYIILLATEDVGARYFATFLAAGGVFPSIGNILPWVMNNQGSDTRRGIATVMLNVVGQCGPLLGTRVYTDAPRYVKGHGVCAAFMFFTTILAFSLRTLLAYENRQLDKKYGSVEEARAKEAEKRRRGEQGQDEVAAENYGPTYRYIL